jgi:hypothetical protein
MLKRGTFYFAESGTFHFGLTTASSFFIYLSIEPLVIGLIGTMHSPAFPHRLPPPPWGSTRLPAAFVLGF